MSRITKHRVKKSLRGRAPPKKKRISKQMIWTIIIGGLMVASVFGIMFSSYNDPGEENTFGDYTFERTNLGWVTEINGNRVVFDYLPSDVEEINISKQAVDVLAGAKVMYITFNPNSENIQALELMRFEMLGAFEQMFGMYSLVGITEENQAYQQPIVDCGNATAMLPVIHIIESNQTSVQLDNSCVVLEVEDYSASALKDRLLYGMLGII
jgi:hypothetical protein